MSEPNDPSGHYASGLVGAAEVKQPVVINILHRFLQRGWITCLGRGKSPKLRGSPRKYYRVTESGRLALAELINGLKQ